MGAAIFLLFAAVAFIATGYRILHGIVSPVLLPTTVERNLWNLSCWALLAYSLLLMLIYGLVDAELKFAKGSWIAEARVIVLKWKSSYKAWSKRNKFWRISALLGVGLLLLVYFQPSIYHHRVFHFLETCTGWCVSNTQYHLFGVYSSYKIVF